MKETFQSFIFLYRAIMIILFSHIDCLLLCWQEWRSDSEYHFTEVSLSTRLSLKNAVK